MKDLDLVCFSHLRWNFVFQRPQHLLTRFAKQSRVFYVEEPIFHDGADHNQVTEVSKNIWIIVPHLQHGGQSDIILRQQNLLKDLFSSQNINRFVFWYYTPMSLEFGQVFNPELVVYDCMDELSAFKFAPASLKSNEELLIKRADLVFTGGQSLYEAKKHSHSQIFPFPSSIDKDHFAQAREVVADPADQQSIPHPRIGFYGVIDERMDIDLIAAVAAARPDLHFVMIGPVVKIDPASLPHFNNVHYLGGKSYQELPSYLAGWDIAIIPFALNESTRFISPTKTPEYLAAGKPVISSSIKDVVNPYGDNHLVHIADTADQFIAAADIELSNQDKKSWLAAVDAFLHDNSWDNTWARMVELIDIKLGDNTKEKKINNLKSKEYLYV